MHKRFSRLAALLLICALLMSMLPVSILAESASFSDVILTEMSDTPIELPEAPADKPTEEPAAEPTEEPATEPTEEPTEEPTDVPGEEPTEAPSEEPAPTQEPEPIAVEEYIPAPADISDAGDFNITEGVLNSYTGTAVHVVIPSTVTSIRYQAFQGNTTIQSVVIPGSVKVIGDDAFRGCTNLTTVTLSEGLETIARHAFYNSGVTTLTTPRSLRNLKAGAFQNCDALTTVTLSEGLLTTEMYSSWGVFEDCDMLRSVSLPSTLQSIAPEMFMGCDRLATVTIANGPVEIGYGAFRSCPKIASIVIPGSVKTIGDDAFHGCSDLASVTLSEGIETIARCVFKESGVTTVTTPRSLRNLKAGAFQNCDALTTVTLSEGLQTTEMYSSWGIFEDCDMLRTVTLPSTLQSIAPEMFMDCDRLTTATIANGPISIGYGAFRSCPKLTDINIPGSVEIIDDDAFHGCSDLTTVTLNEGLEIIDRCAFKESGVTTITTPRSLRNLNAGAFQNCDSLIQFVAQEGLKTTEMYSSWGVFEDCDMLQTVILPTTLENVAPEMFMSCDRLTGVTMRDGLITIGYGAFRSCPALPAIDIPNTVDTIGDDAFRGCTALADVDLGIGLETMGVNAFYESGVTEIVIPGALDTIKGGAFYNCDALTTVVINEGVKAIENYSGNGAFEHCDNLTRVSLPSTLTTLGGEVFKNCVRLNRIVTCEGLKSISYNCFENCSALDYIVVPRTVDTMGDNVFKNCGGVVFVYDGSYAHTYCQNKAASQKFTYLVLGANNSVNLQRPEMGLSQVISSLKLGLTWNEIDHSDGYELWRSDAADGTYTKIGETTNLELVDEHCLFGKINYYKVRGYVVIDGNRYYGPYSVYRTCFGLATPGIHKLEKTSQGVKITAATVANATGYYIYRCDEKYGLYERLGTTTLANGVNTFVDTTAGNEITYFYKARAYYVSPTGVTYVGPFSMANSITLTSTVLARPVMDLSYVISSLKLKLTWEAVPGANGYELWRSDAAAGTYVKIGETTNLELTDEHCLFGQINYYKVRAYKTVGNGRTYSDMSVYRTCFGLATPGIQKLEPQSNGVKVTAATVANATGYYIYRCTEKNGLYDRLGTTTLSGGLNTYLDTTAQPGTTYYYKCRAYYVSPTGVTYVGPFSVAKSAVR